jgi:hypothetical protein
MIKHLDKISKLKKLEINFKKAVLYLEVQNFEKILIKLN